MPKNCQRIPKEVPKKSKKKSRQKSPKESKKILESIQFPTSHLEFEIPFYLVKPGEGRQIMPTHIFRPSAIPELFHGMVDNVISVDICLMVGPNI